MPTPVRDPSRPPGIAIIPPDEGRSIAAFGAHTVLWLGAGSAGHRRVRASGRAS